MLRKRRISSENKVLSGLNPEQKKAVVHDQGPLLIIAGAGTGKTTVISRRIAYLIAGKKAKPSEILALTFTDKAADEMETRVDKLVPYGYVDVNIQTFHAFGDRLLKEYALDLGIRPDYKVLSKPEQIVFFREHVFDLPLKHFISLGDPSKHIEALINVISRAKDEDISPGEYEKAVRRRKDAKQIEIAKVYKEYQKLKFSKHFVDFGDQIALSLKLLREHPDILKKVQNRFKYILVDEFQDTNYAQFQLVRLLAKKHKNITVVGDDDQSIYKFRGAAISNILSFEKLYPKTKKVVLTRNYRSTQVILDTAYKLVRHNDPDRLEVKSRIDKRLKAVSKDKGRIVDYKQFDRLDSEADQIAKEIRERFDSEENKYADFAILVRSNRAADAFQKALNMQTVPWTFSGNRGLYSHPEVQLAVSFLKVLGDLSDSPSLYYLASSDIYQLNAHDLQKINTFAGRRNYTLHHVFQHLDDGGEFEILNDVTSETRATIKKIMDDIRYYLDLAKERTTGEVLHRFFKRSGYLKRLQEQESLANDEKIKNLSKFFDRITEFKEVAEVDRVAEFVKYLNLLKDAGDDPESAQADFFEDAVSILTVHKAKGLEFPVVYIVGLADDKFPVRRRRDSIELPEYLIKETLPKGDFHLQEERRLFYVAMTRAQKELYLSSSLNYGGKRDKKVSRFVLEALDRPKADFEVLRTRPIDQIELFASAEKGPAIGKPMIKKDQLVDLSSYKINDYLTCPLKYKYINILKVPLLPNHAIIYGSALHKAVQAYEVARINKKKFSLKDLLAVFADNWSSEGFISREHEKQRLAVGKKALKKYFKEQSTSKKVPTRVEMPFTIIKDGIRLRGRFDRVDINGKKVRIIDYKSSDVRSKEEADKKARSNVQLSIYALAWLEMEKKIPDSVELHFLDTGFKGRTKKNPKQIEKLWEKIVKVADGVRKRDFTATPEYHACRLCPYNDECPASVV